MATETRPTSIHKLNAIDALADLRGAAFLIGCVAESQSFSEEQGDGMLIIERVVSSAHDALYSYLVE